MFTLIYFQETINRCVCVLTPVPACVYVGIYVYVCMYVFIHMYMQRQLVACVC